MGGWLWPFLEELRQTFRIADAFDIALISVALYASLVWFRSTASRNLAIGISSFAVLYFVARVFDLYLTSLVFHGAFAALLVALVVEFQDDLRRMLERLASWGSLAKARTLDNVYPETDLLVDSAFFLAEIRTGALIVLKGRESLERHLDGGIPVDGLVSKPLLCSIFDASSPGHDGAVVLIRDRVEMIGVHLPISRNQSEIRGRGTRHCAALGMTEQSDALVIVVSEERGAVSVAERGKLQACGTAATLKGLVDDFYKTRYPESSPHAVRRFVIRHWPLKMVSLTLAVAAWFTLAYQPNTIQRTFVATVEYRNVPQGLIIHALARTEARITLSGLERAFRFFDPASLTVKVDLSGFHAGGLDIALTEKDVRIPANLSIYRIEPRILYITLHEQSDQTPEAASVGPRP